MSDEPSRETLAAELAGESGRFVRSSVSEDEGPGLERYIEQHLLPAMLDAVMLMPAEQRRAAARLQLEDLTRALAALPAERWWTRVHSLDYLNRLLPLSSEALLRARDVLADPSQRPRLHARADELQKELEGLRSSLESVDPAAAAELAAELSEAFNDLRFVRAGGVPISLRLSRNLENQRRSNRRAR